MSHPPVTIRVPKQTRENMFTTTVTFEDPTGLFAYTIEHRPTVTDALAFAYDYMLADDVAEAVVDSPEGERVLTYVRPS